MKIKFEFENYFSGNCWQLSTPYICFFYGGDFLFCISLFFFELRIWFQKKEKPLPSHYNREGGC